MRLQFRSWALLAATMLACAICVTAPSRADTVVFDGTDSGVFGRLDLNTGVFTQTATLTGITPAGLAEVGSTLYTADYPGTAFYRLNPISGAVTQISNIGLDGNNYADLGSTPTGVYAIDSSGNLYFVNPATGASSLIGPTGVAPTTDPTTGFEAFSLSTGSATLYYGNLNELYSVNTSTGAATLLGSTGAAGIGIDALVTTNGALYAGEVTNTSLEGTIYTLNSSTGAGTLGPVITPVADGNVPFGLAPIFAVPEPSTWAMMVVGFAGLGFAGWRKTPPSTGRLIVKAAQL
jgi:hypothetical protein